MTKHPKSQELYGIYKDSKHTPPDWLQKIIDDVQNIECPDLSSLVYFEVKNIYVRNMSDGLYYRIKNLQRHLECSTWTSFFYEVDRIVTQYLKETKGIDVKA